MLIDRWIEWKTVLCAKRLWLWEQIPRFHLSKIHFTKDGKEKRCSRVVLVELDLLRSKKYFVSKFKFVLILMLVCCALYLYKISNKLLYKIQICKKLGGFCSCKIGFYVQLNSLVRAVSLPFHFV